MSQFNITIINRYKQACLSYGQKARKPVPLYNGRIMRRMKRGTGNTENTENHGKHGGLIMIDMFVNR